MDDHYLDAANYHRMIEALAGLKPSMWGGDKLDPDQIKAILGEIGGVWPMTAHPAVAGIYDALDRLTAPSET